MAWDLYSRRPLLSIPFGEYLRFPKKRIESSGKTGSWERFVPCLLGPCAQLELECPGRQFAGASFIIWTAPGPLHHWCSRVAFKCTSEPVSTESSRDQDRYPAAATLIVCFPGVSLRSTGALPTKLSSTETSASWGDATKRTTPWRSAGAVMVGSLGTALRGGT